MFRNLSRELNKAMQAAREQAAASGHDTVLPEHLLMGASRLAGTPTSDALVEAGFDHARAGAFLAAKYPPGSLPLTGNSVLSAKLIDAMRLAELDTPEGEKLQLHDLLARVVLLGSKDIRDLVDVAGAEPGRLLAALNEAAGTYRENRVAAETTGDAGTHGPDAPVSSTAVDPYTRDLVAEARAGRLDPVVGREAELRRVIQVLARRSKNNPVLVGDPGVGKSAIVEGLAALLATGDVPDALKGRPLLAVDLGKLVAGAKYRGDFEKRLTTLLEYAERTRSLLAIDEIHTLVGVGSGSESTMDAGQMLKESLARRRVSILGATTLKEYREHIASDAALERRFTPIDVGEPSVEDTVTILNRVSVTYAAHHGVEYTPDALSAAAHLADRHLRDRFNPDKAIDVIDEAGARLAIASSESGSAVEGVRPTVSEELVTAVVAELAGVAVGALSAGGRTLLAGLADNLRGRAVGQDTAVDAVARVVRRRRSGLSPNCRPASFLFAGPTGTGKTELSKALADALAPGVKRNLIRFDMSEFAEKHSVARLFGSPPGYVGYTEGGQLTEAVRRDPAAVVLLDEVDKAHPDVFDALLAVLEEGRMTDGMGRSVSFVDATLVMTTNFGARESSRPRTGFLDAGATDSEAITRQVLKNAFRPEFLNRLDEIVVFGHLSTEDLRIICAGFVDEVVASAAHAGVQLDLDDDVIDHLVERGTSVEYGARYLRRTVERLLTDHVTDAVLDGAAGRRLVTVADGEVTLARAEEKVAVGA